MKLRTIAVMLTALTLIFFGCGGGEEDKPAKPSAQPAAKPAAKPAPKPAAAVESEAKFNIKDASGKVILKVKRMRADRWTVTAGSDKYALESEGSDVYKFALPDGAELKAKRNEDKLKLKRGEDVLVEVKFYSDKYKITPTGLDTYEFKYKSEKVKVYIDERELGAVKYYPDTGKLKAKDPDGKEIAVAKGLDKLNAGLAPFLMADSVPKETRYFLIALFFAMNK